MAWKFTRHSTYRKFMGINEMSAGKKRYKKYFQAQERNKKILEATETSFLEELSKINAKKTTTYDQKQRRND